MQKKIIALAVAGLMSGAAFAQSNVTVYGVLDIGYNHISGGNDSQNNIDGGMMSGSRLGFKGTEDLGNGLKALFVLEYGLANDDNTGVGAAHAGWSSTAARQQLVGLTGSFGTVVAGRAQTLAYDWACMVSPLAGTAFDSVGKLAASTTLSCGSAGRANNAVAYVSPEIAGFTFAYNHARLTETAGTDGFSDDSANMLGLTYKNGPIAVGLAYSAISDGKTLGAAGVYNVTTGVTSAASTTATSNADVKEWGLGGSYDFGVAKLFGSYQRNKVDGTDADKKWQLGVSAPIGANGSLAFTYAKSTIDSSVNDDSKAWGLAYVHNLSKRTNVYGGYSRINNDSGDNRSIKGVTVAAGDDVSVYGVGLRHSF